MGYDTNQPDLKRLKLTYSEATKRTVFFIGSGPSTEVGIPGWHDLAQNLCTALDDATPSSALNNDLLDAFHQAEEFLKSGALWEFFQIVELHWPGVYEDYLSDVFSTERVSTCPVPSVYKRVWKMRNVGQLLTLNIDGLLRRAYDEVFSNSSPVLEFPGLMVNDSKSYFQRNYPVILNLHGVYTHRTTWVMSRQERERLFTGISKGDYRAFLRHIFETCNVVFVGVNIRDVAISPILEEINSSNLLQNHYWITSDITTENYQWCQKRGVRVINYSPEVTQAGKKVHSTVICSILDEIESFRSLDKPVILPEREVCAGKYFGDCSELLGEIASDSIGVRKKLDARFEHLGRQHGFDGKQVAGFIREYGIPIELCSVMGPAKPYNVLETGTISSNISSTNASNVWLMLQADGSSMCAVKSMSSQAFKDPIERESFRRGVESVYQLNTSNESVAPRYIFHTNVPMAFGMELINGASLRDFSESSADSVRKDWKEIFLKICRAIHHCHRSNGQVLHRDIKPKNIIFEGAYQGCDPDEFLGARVRLINFDMSWHKFSAGNSKSVPADEVGYYAPEQRHFENSESPRSAKTDVYMLGMLLLHMLSEMPPPEGGSRLENWENYVRQKVGSATSNQLVKFRVARLIIKMTAIDLDARPDLQGVISEVEAIGLAATSEWKKVDPDLFVEKVLTEAGYDYDWSDEKLKGTIRTPRLIDLSIGYKPRGQRIEINWTRQRDEGVDRKNFGGKLGDLSLQIRQQLRDFGWDADDAGGHHGRSVQASIRHSLAVENPLVFIDFVKSVVGRMMSSL